MEKVKKGKIIVNICIGTILLDRIWRFIEAILNNKQSSSVEIVITCLFLAVIILYYLGNKVALDIITSLVPYYFAILPFLMIIPVMYFLDLVVFAKMGEGKTAILVVFYFVGISTLYLMLKKYELFNCVKVYKGYIKDKTD
ncbi:hypothetical protein [Clostridium omnivorum]|uniref:Uncharacterized protein n=1 Tax=Clostridium omnivorum TaxID=1604902 RepID=A0ABQ5N7V4_9CLOT|nr:hypothetical protein [Clostridium sp. E14]GLC31221.1 hypothetical protein bsdE14_26310 [Clostridium sp. E14]